MINPFLGMIQDGARRGLVAERRRTVLLREQRGDGMGAAGTPIGATVLGGVKRSTDRYRQPYGAVTSAPGSPYTPGRDPPG